MKVFIYKSLIIVSLVVLIDITAYFVFQKVFSEVPEKNTEIASVYQTFFKKKCDVLILGPSTARHNYNTIMMQDSLQMEVYNAGLDGRDIVYCSTALQEFVKRCNLKLVILDVTAAQFDDISSSRMKLTRYYYGLNESITDFFNNDTDWQQVLKMKIALYRYNTCLTDIIRIALKDYNTTGFEPLQGEAVDPHKYLIEDFVLDSTEYKYLNKLISFCKNNNIRLLLVRSPQYGDRVTFGKWLSDYSNKNSIELVEENKNPYYYEHPDLFKDETHLNGKGADLFTQNIINIIQLNRKYD